MPNFAMIWTIMNIGMDDDWTQKWSGTDTHATGHQKITKYSKSEKMLLVFLTIRVNMKLECMNLR